jgi:hypothetical protein
MFLLVPLADQCHRQQPGAESRVNVLEEVQEGVAQGSFASSNHETQVFVGNIGGHALQEDPSVQVFLTARGALNTKV